MCGPSSFTTAYLTTKNGERTTTISRRNIKASSFRESVYDQSEQLKSTVIQFTDARSISNRERDFIGVGRTTYQGRRRYGSQISQSIIEYLSVADMDQDHLLAQLERQSLIVSPSPLPSSVIRPFSTLHTQLVWSFPTVSLSRCQSTVPYLRVLSNIPNIVVSLAISFPLCQSLPSLHLHSNPNHRVPLFSPVFNPPLLLTDQSLISWRMMFPCPFRHWMNQLLNFFT